MVGGVGVCFAGGSGGGALTNVYTGLIIHTDSPPPSYTYTNYTATTHLYTSTAAILDCPPDGIPETRP